VLPNNEEEEAAEVATVAAAVVVAVGAVVEAVAVAVAGAVVALTGITGVLEFNVDTVCFKRSSRRKRRCSTSRARSSSACLRASMETVAAVAAPAVVAEAAAAAGIVGLVGLLTVTDRTARSSGAPLGVTTREDAEEVGNESKSVISDIWGIKPNSTNQCTTPMAFVDAKNNHEKKVRTQGNNNNNNNNNKHGHHKYDKLVSLKHTETQWTQRNRQTCVVESSSSSSSAWLYNLCKTVSKSNWGIWGKKLANWDTSTAARVDATLRADKVGERSGVLVWEGKRKINDDADPPAALDVLAAVCAAAARAVAAAWADAALAVASIRWESSTTWAKCAGSRTSSRAVTKLSRVTRPSLCEG
jgi:hypothetical protein